MMKFGSKTQEKLKMIKCFPSMEMLPLKGFMVLHSVYSIGTFFFVHKHFIHSLERKKKNPENLVCFQFLPGKSHGQGSLVGYSPQGHKDQDMTEQLNTHTHSLSIHPPFFHLISIIALSLSWWRKTRSLPCLSKISPNCSVSCILWTRGRHQLGRRGWGGGRSRGEWHNATWQPSLKLEFLSYERFTIFILSQNKQYHNFCFTIYAADCT